MLNNHNINNSYKNWINVLKRRIAEARHKAALSLNSALIELYWYIGEEIIIKEKQAEWGSGFIERLSRDLTDAFPDMKGFSRRNLYAIRQWYLFYSAQFQIVPQPVAQIPWGHNRLIITKIRDIEAQEREIEHALTQKITDFLLELGKGFAFIGRQYKLVVSENEYFLDMLFYHLNLRTR